MACACPLTYNCEHNKHERPSLTAPSPMPPATSRTGLSPAMGVKSPSAPRHSSMLPGFRWLCSHEEMSPAFLTEMVKDWVSADSSGWDEIVHVRLCSLPSSCKIGQYYHKITRDVLVLVVCRCEILRACQAAHFRCRIKPHSASRANACASHSMREQSRGSVIAVNLSLHLIVTAGKETQAMAHAVSMKCRTWKSKEAYWPDK